MSAGGPVSGLSGEGLGHGYAGQEVFSGVAFLARRGEVVCLTGPNGQGKSTLVRILSGIERPRAGRVMLDGAPLTSLPPRERARRVGALLSSPDTTFGFTARELVLMGRYPHMGKTPFASPLDLERCERALALLDLEAIAERPIFELSAGQRQRVGLARLVCQDPEVFLFDEPTSNLDPAHTERFIALVETLAADGRAVVCVVHDLDLLARMAHRVAILAGGVMAVTGSPAEVLVPDTIERIWGVPALRVDAVAGRPAVVLGRRSG